MWDSSSPPSSSRISTPSFRLGGLGVVLLLAGFGAWRLAQKTAPSPSVAVPAGPGSSAYIVIAGAGTSEGTLPGQPDCLVLQPGAGSPVWYSGAGTRVRGELASRLWTLLTTAQPQRERQLAPSDEDYGLTRCRLRVGWGSAGLPAHSLCFGEDAPGDLIYARQALLPRRAAPGAPSPSRCSDVLVAEDDAAALRRGRLQVFDRALFTQLLQAVATYRELRPLPWPSSVVARIDFSDGTQALRRPAGWRDEHGIALPDAAVHAFLADLGRDLADPPATPGPAPAQIGEAAPAIARELRLQSEAGESLRLTLRGSLLQRDGEPPIPIAEERMQPWLRSARDLRDRRVLTVEPAAITRLSVQAVPPHPSWPEQRVERRPHGFVLTAPPLGEADAPSLHELFQTLGGLQAESEPSGPQAAQPEGTHLLLRVAAPGREQELTLTPPVAGACDVLIAAPPRRLRLARLDCQRLWLQLTTPWLSHNLLFFDDARLFAVQGQCGRASSSLTRRGDGFWLGEHRLSAEQRRARLGELHALARAEGVRYAVSPSAKPAATACTLRIRHSPLALLQEPGVLAPDSAPVEQCVEVLADGWLRRCGGVAVYRPSTAGQAALRHLLP